MTLPTQTSRQRSATSWNQVMPHARSPPAAWSQPRDALRFGDERVMALVGALCVNLHAVAGFTNGSSVPW
jgi:hypothetical protein